MSAAKESPSSSGSSKGLSQRFGQGEANFRPLPELPNYELDSESQIALLSDRNLAVAALAKPSSDGSDLVYLTMLLSTHSVF